MNMGNYTSVRIYWLMETEPGKIIVVQMHISEPI